MEGKGRRQIINRLKRIEGQIRGLEKMIENETPCLDILTQVSAVTAAIKKAGYRGRPHLYGPVPGGHRQ